MCMTATTSRTMLNKSDTQDNVEMPGTINMVWALHLKQVFNNHVNKILFLGQ